VANVQAVMGTIKFGEENPSISQTRSITRKLDIGCHFKLAKFTLCKLLDYTEKLSNHYLGLKSLFKVITTYYGTCDLQSNH